MLDLQEENYLFAKGIKYVGGIDEVGRGPLAGPVVAACVMISREDQIIEELIREVNDSKKISEKKREHLYDLILQNIPHVGIGMCDHETIDKINILEASFLAMKKAIGALKVKPDFILVDGSMAIRNLSTAQKSIIKGDSKVFCIAAASIVAKVFRDRIMLAQHGLYPNYSFDKHKGYGTKLHLERLALFGPCPIHRKSFRPVADLIVKNKKMGA